MKNGPHAPFCSLCLHKDDSASYAHDHALKHKNDRLASDYLTYPPIITQLA